MTIIKVFLTRENLLYETTISDHEIVISENPANFFLW